ncbi:hypothetical protein [Geminocystis herdmanii]|uniref:hypothetical protein n=1 Tax=Geminocystis herdmanii TaxID=669359 RepID=UPI000348AE07|nr:hypothetical protein [Geminocystis herdmanii]
MTLTQILPVINTLNKQEKIYLLQTIINQLAEEENSLFRGNQEYPIYSPLDTFSAGDTLLKLLAENKDNE